MSSDNNNTASLGTSTNMEAAGSDDIKTTATASVAEVKTTNIIAAATSDGTNAKDTSKSAAVSTTNLSTLSLTDTTIYTTYSLTQLDSWISAYHAEAALVRDKIRPLTTSETAILEKLLTQRRGVENSTIYKEKYEKFMAKEKTKRRDGVN